MTVIRRFRASRRGVATLFFFTLSPTASLTDHILATDALDGIITAVRDCWPTCLLSYHIVPIRPGADS